MNEITTNVPDLRDVPLAELAALPQEALGVEADEQEPARLRSNMDWELWADRLIGRPAGFAWAAVTVWVPWRLAALLAPFDRFGEEIPGFIQGEIAALSMVYRWKGRRNARRVAKGKTRHANR